MTTQAPIGPTVQNSIVSPYVYPNQWHSPKTVTKVTETMEYDEKGNLVKKTVVTETTTEQGNYPTVTWNTYESNKHVYDAYLTGK